MRIPTIRGIIDRRILVNYHIDADTMRRALPAPFRPKLVKGFAIGGICLIRLKGIRPAFLPLPIGVGSENGAHRIAVEWDDAGTTREGVYIPRRDTDSRLNHLAGGRLFPGIHHHARFTTRETDDHYFIEFVSDDDATRVRVEGRLTRDWPANSVFGSVREASDFFETGSLGYSATRSPNVYEGLELACDDWHCDTLEVKDVFSSYFGEEDRFPAGSVHFDCALLMRGIRHQWQSRKGLCCTSGIDAND
ncbi:MAG: DUF2071 domain-containing protein [Phycisphaerales bacterium]|nr:DUF2071 domain-containing protein [Phycisphaerales bacterium]MCB9856422.1 DUF2071 domain-containing protein [Phycisphaerales bacterium]MCB9864553.1 DUF2071 domain-containing protein [Phycisphaerales bacterium]